MRADMVVVGAGMVGSAVAYGLAGRGLDVLVIDGCDRDFRSASANFGLVWLHGKGMDMPAYQMLTRAALDLWPDFAEDLTNLTGIDLQYEHKGGLALCLGEAEFEERRGNLQRLHNQLGAVEPDWEMVDRRKLERLLPGVRLGAEVTGASFGLRDGHANPLRLLAALQEGAVRKGARFVGAMPAHRLIVDGTGFRIEAGSTVISCARVVIAAGLGSKTLGTQVGLDIPIRPQRGQILVTERLEPFLALPTLDIRQTGEGTVMIGSTNEEAGFDASATVEAAASMSDRALRQMPELRDARLVRQWAGLRILTPDGFPVYAESASCPGAYIALCHSGVTLSSYHAGVLADAIADSALPSSLDDFHHRRFDVPKAA